MVGDVRKILLPLPSDPPRSPGLLKFDFQLDRPFYFERTQRKLKCECIKILKKVAPNILKKESKETKQQSKEEMQDLQDLLKIK